MKVVVVMHTPEEPAEMLGEELKEQGAEVEVVNVYETGHLVMPVSATHLVLLGGPMSVNDTATLPFIEEEQRAIREFVAAGKPVLGICLGAQQIATAFGGIVTKSVEEIGWRMIAGDGTIFPNRFLAFQLHGETFSVPAGGTLLCRGEEVQNQGFLYKCALGLQFHLEMTSERIEALITDRSPAEQAAIREESRMYAGQGHQLCRRVTGFFLSL
ncbi:type 1 glutamine amidotransferase [Methanosphaerula subterraneus]|uniref:type 1 glutamine amidotransferase n=1 Tax=Methanosphaerula subterraneus TaxID=3350244 RepID=UPI003F86F6AA